MTLRRRLLMIGTALLVVWVVAAAVIVLTQRGLLVSQIDDQLLALPADAFTGLTQPSNDFPGDVPIDAAANSPFSNIIVGVVSADSSTTTLFAGQMTADAPDLSGAVDQVDGQAGVTTIDSSRGSSRFRARVIPQPNSTDFLVAASPLTEVDAAITRLETTLVITGIVLVLVLGLAYVWIERLGLRPIARVTAVALAISAGDRSRRVPSSNTGTEAGQLGEAINVMLDERDATDERLQQFVADASHELRTPLTSVRGYLDLYQQGAFRKPGQLDDAIRRMAAEAQRMGGLVDDMLLLASLDEARPLRLTQVDIKQLLADAAMDGRAVQPARQITVKLPEKELTVKADHTLLAQLISILVANALTHTPVNEVITISAENLGDDIRLVVADTGPGMEPEVAKHAFDRFWRGSAGRERSGGSRGSRGAGLGLAIARSIVEQHNGTITLDTAPGIGSEFSIHLPIPHDDREDPSAQNKA